MVFLDLSIWSQLTSTVAIQKMYPNFQQMVSNRQSMDTKKPRLHHVPYPRCRDPFIRDDHQRYTGKIKGHFGPSQLWKYFSCRVIGNMNFYLLNRYHYLRHPLSMY